uniref:Ig-like domain-containing protein n=1 Tax=Oryzias latipes TaxID=8090 RepID=A0A3P9IKN5_ORYLA
VMETEGSSPLGRSMNLKEPPSFQVKGAPCDQAVIEGEDVVMTAKFRGQPKPMVNWLKDNVMVKTVGRFVVHETENATSELRINAAQKSDGGIYVCKIINEYGTKQAECRLKVKGESKIRIKEISKLCLI